MKKKREIGFEGEDVACEFLESIGYDIIERYQKMMHDNA